MGANMTKNPFSLSFGKEPISLINRSMQTAEIIETFEDENPAYQVCMITGDQRFWKNSNAYGNNKKNKI